MTREDHQLELDFDPVFPLGENPALWTPRDIWVRLNQRLMRHLGEDRRLDFKRAGRKIDFEDYATYLSMYSNTPDGGVIIFGGDSKGNPTGCNSISREMMNKSERCHTNLCPRAKPEFKRIGLMIEDKSDFALALYIPYVGVLVETHKDEAYIRYGDSRHLMSDVEKRDFRSTRQELSFEMENAPYKFPEEFDLAIIQDFCDAFRFREGRAEWSNEDILVDRHLATRTAKGIQAHNALVLLAGKDPAKTIPGCRVRVQRFGDAAEGVGAEYNPLRDRFYEGNIVRILLDAQRQINTFFNFDVTWLNNQGKFVTTPEYPQWAWFEALVNAFVHRSYSFSGTEITVKFFPDRLEVESPGGFVPPVNEKTIYSTRATRNYHLMDALRVLGYVQMAREGTRRIQASMKEWGLPDPIFKQEALHGVVVRVTLKNDHENRKRATDRDVAQFFGVDIWKTLEEHEVKIAAYAYHNKRMQVTEAQNATGRRWQTSKKDLERLVRKGILEFVPGDYPRDSKSHYALKERIR